MDGLRFDSLVERLAEAGSRRRVLAALGLSAVITGGLPGASSDADAGKRGHKKKRKKGKKVQQGPALALGEICTPGKSTCVQGLKCDSPTTRQNCNSTVEGVDSWCCVPPNGQCSGCECCGDFYCGGDGVCIPNPENKPG